MEASRPSGRIHMRTGAGLRAEVAAVGWPAWLECRVGWVEMAARGTIAAKTAHAAVRGMSTLGTHDDRVLLPLKDRVIGSDTYLWYLISYPLISLPLFPQRAGRYTSKCFYRRICGGVNIFFFLYKIIKPRTTCKKSIWYLFYILRLWK